MTPLELKAELEEAKKDDERKFNKYHDLLKIIDTHFALAHTMQHNLHSRRSAKIDDYKMLSSEQRQTKFTPEQLAIDAKLRAEARARLAKRQREALKNGQKSH